MVYVHTLLVRWNGLGKALIVSGHQREKGRQRTTTPYPVTSPPGMPPLVSFKSLISKKPRNTEKHGFTPIGPDGRRMAAAAVSE